jgi:hypothetical protein
MKLRRVSGVIIAVAIAGAGLTACGGSSSSPSAASTPSGSSIALAGSPGDSSSSALATAPASSSTPSASPTITHSVAVKPSKTATAHAKTSTHATTSAHATSSSSSGTHSFTVPSISGDNVVSAYGSYEKIGTERVKVTMCAKQTGTAFSVGAIALVYNSSGSDRNIGATILNGPGNSTCVSTTFLFYTAHLKVHAFIGGSGGTITKTGTVLTLY